MVPANFHNLKNQVFGRLTVIRRAGRTEHGNVTWLCRCSCTKRCTVAGGNLVSGKTQSCGCLQRELAARRSYKHGHGIRGKRSSTYVSWFNMIQRCSNPNSSKFCYYGAVGIRVCRRWLTFKNFLADMGSKPKGTSLSRFGDVGNYTKSNVAWHTRKEQGAERRKKFAALKLAA